MNPFHRFAARGASLLSRPPRLAGAREPLHLGLHRGLFLLFFLSIVTLLFPVLRSEFQRWTAATPAVALAGGEWRVLLTDVGGLESPGSALYGSPLARGDSDHAARVHAMRGKPFWIGVRVTPEALRAAQEARADRLFLGYLSGPHRLYVNGFPRAEGSFRETRSPLWLALSPAELSGKDGLWIAARIEHTEGAVTPDYLSPLFGAGFFTQGATESVARALQFRNETLPAAFFAVNLLFAAFFFLFWNADRSKQDYAYMGFLVLIEAFLQARQIDPVFRVWDQPVIWSLNVSFRVLEGAFGLFLGLSFARSRKEAFLYGIPSALLLAALTPLWIGDSTGKLNAAAFVASRFVPALFLLGAAACALQALFFSTSGLGRSYPVRQKRLVLFAVGLAGVALLHYGVTRNFGSPQHRTIYDRFLHLLFVAYLGGILFSDYREQSRKLATLPVSLYHALTRLPERLRGFVLTVDLKRSNELLRFGANRGCGSETLEAFRDEMNFAAELHSGVVTHRNGDEVKIFFDEARIPGGREGAIRAALACAREMGRRLAYRSARFDGEGAIPEGFVARFRAGLSEGEIRPTWVEGLHSREPAWEEAGGGHAFLGADRLMSLDLQIDPERARSLLVLERTDAEALFRADASLPSAWRMLPLGALRDKEGRLHAAVALEPLLPQDPLRTAPLPCEASA